MSKAKADYEIVKKRRVSCDGSSGPLGHPKVYLEIKQGVEEIVCPYCSKHFIYKDKDE